MTQEEILQRVSSIETDIDEQWCRVGVYEGATANPWHPVADGDLPKDSKDYLCYNGMNVHIGWFDTNKKCFYNTYSRYKERMLDVECWAEIPQLPTKGGTE